MLLTACYRLWTWTERQSAAGGAGLRDALERALAEGVPYLILDGKVVDTDRCREKTYRHTSSTRQTGRSRYRCRGLPPGSHPGR